MMTILDKLDIVITEVEKAYKQDGEVIINNTDIGIMLRIMKEARSYINDITNTLV